MVKRAFWLAALADCWARRSVVWISGVRRAGKTSLCQMIAGAEYLDCERPSVRRELEDPETFLAGMRGRTVVLDEIHRLDNPSELLKLAADHYREVRVVATGSSTLGASAKFADTLSGRKAELWLTPMTMADLEDFQRPDLRHRFTHGGLPPFFLAAEWPEREFQSWLDDYWAKDIQELFRLERRRSFQKFVELLLAQSGGLFEASRFAVPCEVSRPTISNYLAVLEATLVAHVLKPFSSRRQTEIVAAPKVYGFDTGFLCAFRGWQPPLRTEELGVLWEHFVLNELHARLQTRDLRYWRDKRGHEVDFVLVRRGRPPAAIECKWSAAGFDPVALAHFAAHYPGSDLYVVATDVTRPLARTHEGCVIHLVGLEELIQRLKAAPDGPSRAKPATPS